MNNLRAITKLGMVDTPKSGDHKIEVNLGYIACWSPAWETEQNPSSNSSEDFLKKVWGCRW
jgi:hypothetical protein